jgi:hypothetical protein
MSVPLPSWRITTRPHSAPTPSTAVCTTMPSSASRSRPLPSDSPTRRTVSCRRARSSWSSSRRASSWRAIELNSVPSAANSSLPSVGTSTLKSPFPSARAAVRRRSIWDWSERAAVSAKASAQIRNASRISAMPRLFSEIAFSASDSGISTRALSALPSKPLVVNPLARKCSSPT